MTNHKSTRMVTYRKWGVPAVILEGKWLEKDYGWKIGDQIGVAYYPREIRLRCKDIGFVMDRGEIKNNKKQSCKQHKRVQQDQPYKIHSSLQ